MAAAHDTNRSHPSSSTTYTVSQRPSKQSQSPMSMMSPPHLLFDADVLYEIFQYLLPDNDELENQIGYVGIPQRDSMELKRRRKALASAARTCKAFSETAYDALWTALPGLTPILSIFSGYRVAKYEKQNPPTGRYFTTERHVVHSEISPSEWERFDHLAQRVRCLAYNGKEIDGSLLQLLASRYNSSPLFPNLRFLIWHESLGDATKQQVLRSLSSAPNLSTFSLRQTMFNNRVDQDLSVVAAACPHLTHFRTNALGPASQQLLLDTFHNLRSALLAVIGDPLFRRLATLPRLEDLCAYGWPGNTNHNPDTSVVNAPFPKRGFPALRRLQLSRLDGHTAVLRVLSAISSTSLSSLYIQFPATFATDALRCVEGMSSLRALVSLRQFKVHVDAGISPFRDGSERMEIAFSDFVRPLLHLGALKDIALYVNARAWSISDRDLEMVKDTWPHLVRLSVSDSASDHLQKIWQPSGVPVRRPSLTALVALAESCRLLETLDIEVSGISEEELVLLETRVAQDAPLLVPQTALRDVTFARNDYCRRIVLPDVDRLARALHVLFPRLGGLEDQKKGTTLGPVVLGQGWSQDDLENLDIFRFLDTLKRTCIYQA